jgi:hypothetical protein
VDDLAVWHGTEEQTLALLQAVEHNCNCRRRRGKEGRSFCDAHLMLMSNQRALDGLLFVKGLAARLRAEEWGTATPRLDLRNCA